MPARDKIVHMPIFAPLTMSAVFFEIEPLNGGIHSGEFRCSSLGNLPLVHSSTWGQRMLVARTERLIEASSETAFLFAMGLRGSALLFQEGREAKISENTIVLVDSRRSYELEVPEEMEAIWLKIPRRIVEQRLAAHKHCLGRTLSTNVGLGHVAGQMISACLRSSADLQNDDGQLLADHLIDLVTAAFRSLTPDSATSKTSYARHFLERIQHFIYENIENPDLGPAVISKKFKISDRYLRYLFASEGTTLTHWMLTRRLENCRRTLIRRQNAHLSISEIALSSGFSNVSSFNRSFKEYFGVTPSDARTQSSSGTVSDLLDRGVSF